MIQVRQYVKNFDSNNVNNSERQLYPYIDLNT